MRRFPTSNIHPAAPRLLVVFVTLLCVAGPGSSPADDAKGAPAIPFKLTLKGRTINDLPGLHSAAYATFEGKLVLLAGRTNGMHGFPPNRAAARYPSFPRQQANDTIYVVDLRKGELLGKAKVDGLPKPIADQLRATNTQYTTRGGWLYLVGGYGSTENDQSLVTLPQVLGIDLEALIDSIVAGKPLDMDFAKRHMYVGTHPALAITGGELDYFYGQFVLVFGHLFDGEYTPGGGLARQEYSEGVRVFSFSKTGGGEIHGVRKLTVDYKGKMPADAGQDPDGPYHRRDLTVKAALGPNGRLRLGAYAGVFKGGRMEGYLHPVYIEPSATSPVGIALKQDETADQLMNHYKCGAIAMYDEESRLMYTTFFGGISQYYWDDAQQVLKRDPLDFDQRPPVDGLPFINTISTLRVARQGRAATSTAQFLHVDERFPPVAARPGCLTQGAAGETERVDAPYLGTETLFILNKAIPNTHGVIRLNDLRRSKVIGHLIGGIAATSPYPIGSCASPYVYEVTLEIDQPTQTVRLELPASP